MPHYKRHHMRGQPVPTSIEPSVGDPDGHGRYGIMERQELVAQCHECGHWFASVGTHARQAHDLTADEYRAAHGLPRTQPLTSLALSREISEAASSRVGSEAWRRLEAARDPQAAADARDIAAPSAAGTRAVRAARGMDGRLPARRAEVKTCPHCGASYTGRARSCSAESCMRAGRSERSRIGMAKRSVAISDEQGSALRQAAGEALDGMVRELQRQGFSSLSIGKALGRSPAWMSQHYPRTQK